MTSRLALAAAGVAVVGLSLAHSLAGWSALDFAAMCAGTGLLVGSLFRPWDAGNRPAALFPALLALLALVGVTAALTDGDLAPRIVGGCAALAVAAGWLLPALRRRWFPLAALALLGANALTILLYPDRANDIMIYLSVASDRLLHGQPIYGAISSPGNSFVRLTYLPGTVILVTPFHVLLGDIRWTWVAAEAIGIAAIRAVALRGVPAADRSWREALVLLPLALPRVQEDFFLSANNEWLLLGCTGLALWLAMRGRHTLVGIVMGAGLSAKQYFWIYPALFLSSALGRRALLVSLGVGVAVIVPFLAQDPSNALLGMLGVVGKLAPAPDATRVTAWAALAHAGLNPGHLAEVALLAVGLGATLALALRHRDQPGPALAASGAATLLAFLCSPLAGFNYYAYGLAMYCWGTAVSAPPARAEVLPNVNPPGAGG